MKLPSKFQAPHQKEKKFLRGIRPAETGRGVDILWHNGLSSFRMNNVHENVLRCQIGEQTYEYFFGKWGNSVCERYCEISDDFYKELKRTRL